ncbi:helix-turn-helix domain-containing protein [Propionibacterium australiense]|uniref:helix-turn-helix domain-containing protein n=1 Tax=Propionibacterium australiense TaxID=119981 RepID=UPI0015FE3744|nr:helix-turn-helix transcriptional regulator [Propionibacterium australiense]
MTDYYWGHGDPEYDAVYAEESVVGDVGELIALAMERKGVSRAELAERCGVTPGAITQRLDGRSNMTIRKLAATLYQLGYDVRMELVDRDTHERLTLDAPHGARSQPEPVQRLNPKAFGVPVLSSKKQVIHRGVSIA